MDLVSDSRGRALSPQAQGREPMRPARTTAPRRGTAGQAARNKASFAGRVRRWLGKGWEKSQAERYDGARCSARAGAGEKFRVAQRSSQGKPVGASRAGGRPSWVQKPNATGQDEVVRRW